MPEERLKKLGTEKTKVLNADFDTLYEKYKNKALEAGCKGEIKFIREHGRVLIYVVL
jgi:hypothetical protein